jgi:iron(III) transport system ATP-binding protein
MSAIFTLHSVTKTFSNNQIPAIQQMTLSLPQGDLLSVLGPSGCGKTTLLRLIAGFERPDSGAIEIADRLVAGKGHWIPPEARNVGLVFQDFALFPHLTGAQNIKFGLRGSQSGNRVKELITLVGLSGFEDRYPHQLSGGQQQRVALARALAPSPALILLDEPLSSLDVQVRLHLREEIRRVLKETGISAIFVTHDQEEALAISDRVAVLSEGRLMQIDTPEAIYQTPASRFVAEFVTQANFLPAFWQNGQWQTEIGSVSLPAQKSPRGEVMVRQEELHIIPQDQGLGLIQNRQFLGREYRYSLQLPSGQVLLARSPYRFPDKIRIDIQLAKSVNRVFV